MMSNISLVINAVVFLAVVSLAITWKHWVPRMVEYAFDKKLIKYKTDLETEKDKQLADYGKTITGFNKFFDKKYEFYPVLYGSIIKLHGELSEWAPMQSFPEFEKLTTDEFSEYIYRFGFSMPDRRNLIAKKQQGTVGTNDIYILLPQHFRRCIGETNNYFLAQRLFFSKEIESLVELFLKNTVQIQSGYRNVCSASVDMAHWDAIESKNEENAKLVEDLLCQMRSELEHSISKNAIMNE